MSGYPKDCMEGRCNHAWHPSDFKADLTPSASESGLREALENTICHACDNRIGFTGDSKRFDWRNCESCKAARAVLADTREGWRIELLSGKGNWSEAVAPYFNTFDQAQDRADELEKGSGLGVKYRVMRRRS